jgi:hypothetical protein
MTSLFFPVLIRAKIAFAFDHAHQPHLDDRGDLVLHFGSDEFRLQKPRAYQVIAGKQVEVAAAYSMRKGRFHFQLGHYAPDATLIIDPVLVYSTFWGGGFGVKPGFQTASAVAVDGSSNLYVAGFTNPSSFPISTGALARHRKVRTFPKLIPPAPR